MNRNEYPLAIGSLIALYRLPLAVLCLLLALGGCGACGLLAYSLGARPEYTVNWHPPSVVWRTGSAAVSVDGCTVRAGWWDEAARVGDSYDWKVC